MILSVGPLPEVIRVLFGTSFVRFRRACLTVVLLAGGACAALAAEPAPLSLVEAERLALEDEPGANALTERARALEAAADAAGALPEPQLKVALNNFPVESGGFSTEGMTSASLGLRQTFPPGASRRLRSEELDWRAAAKYEAAGARRRAVLMATRKAWLALYYWQQAGVQVRESRPFFEELSSVTRSLYSVGRKSQQDVLRAELELSRLDDRLITIEQQQAAARARFAQWVGRAASRPLAERLPEWEAVPTLSDLAERLPLHAIVKSADAEIASRASAVDVATERRKPGWALDVGYAYREGSLPAGTPRSDFLSIGVTFGLPFTRKRSIDSNLQAALSERSAAASARQQLLRELNAELAAEHVRFTQSSRRVALYERQILAGAREHASAALDAYQSDTADFADVMRAYIDDLQTRTDYIELKVTRAESYSALAYLGGF
ncbi:MAG: TolC family protein [Pseudomonadota bacterium]